MILRFLLVASFAVSAFAQTTRVLVPVFYNGPGGFGSQWFTTVNLNNFTSQTVAGHGLTFMARSCQIPEGCPRSELAPGEYGSVGSQFTPANFPAGFFLYLPSAETNAFEIDARFGETTRNLYGVELPIAREADFRRTAIVLPYVAFTGFHNELRTTVRVYSPDPIFAQRVRVEIRNWGAQATAAPLGSVDVTLDLFDPGGTAEPLQPAFAQIELQRVFPSVFSGVVSVRVIPLQKPFGPIPRIWAFATAVRNDNNEVAVFSPRF
jgi:hypothetical protein